MHNVEIDTINKFYVHFEVLEMAKVGNYLVQLGCTLSFEVGVDMNYKCYTMNFEDYLKCIAIFQDALHGATYVVWI